MGPSSTLSSGHRDVCSRGTPFVVCVGPSFVVGPTTVGALVGGLAPGPVGCQALPCVEAAGLLVGGAGS